MDVSTAVTLTPTQHLIIWTLLGLLLTWMILFTLLAIRPDKSREIEIEVPITPSTPLPIVTATTTLQPVTSPSGKAQLSTAESITYDSPVALEQTQ